jgi:hypothetical protein
MTQRQGVHREHSGHGLGGNFKKLLASPVISTHVTLRLQALGMAGIRGIALATIRYAKTRLRAVHGLFFLAKASRDSPVLLWMGM